MMKHIFFILFLFIAPVYSGLFAQERGNVEVVIDPRVGMIQAFRAGKSFSNTKSSTDAVSPSERSKANRTTSRGFRVQIFLGSSRSDAYAEQARFKRLFPDIDSYVTYEEPNYRVKVGDFTSRSDAEQMMRGLRTQFSNVFVFTEEIFIYQ